MHRWATNGNSQSFLLMVNCYHKRNTFLLENMEENGLQQFLQAAFITLISYRRENWSVMALPSHLERFALFIKLNMVSCIYLIDLNLIKSKYIFVYTTILLNAISVLFWFINKLILFAILLGLYPDLKWLD